MKPSDLNKRVVVFDRPKGEGNGILGTVIEVYDTWTFRIRTDNGYEHEVSIAPRKDGEFTPWVKFIDNQEVRQ